MKVSMDGQEVGLLREELGDFVEPRLSVCTDTRIDAGCWLKNAPVWLCVTDDELVILAVDRRRHIERMPISYCQQSFYNQATGELVLKPVEGLRYSAFAMSPQDALKLLRAIGIES